MKGLWFASTATSADGLSTITSQRSRLTTSGWRHRADAKRRRGGAASRYDGATLAPHRSTTNHVPGGNGTSRLPPTNFSLARA